MTEDAQFCASSFCLPCFLHSYRAENLCYQFIHGQKLPPQFRQIICLLFCVLCTQADKRTLIQGVLIHGICSFEDGIGVARRRDSERRAFVAHKLLLLQPQQVAVVRLGSLCSSSHTAKNFAFIFDIQAQVRLFLPCGSPCVRSTSDCAVLLRSRRIKDGGIISEMSLSMRALSVVPRYAVAVGSLLRGNGGVGATR